MNDWRPVFSLVLASFFFLSVPCDADYLLKGGYSGPERLFVGVAFLDDQSRFQIDVSAGTGGGKIGIGPVLFLDDGSTGSNSGIPIGSFFTVVPRAVFVRSWGSPLHVAPDQNMVGGELEVAWTVFIGFHIGVLRPIGGDGPKNIVASWGVRFAWPFD